MQAADVTLAWLNSAEDAFREPIIIEDPAGLGMRMPGWPSDNGPGSEGSSDFDVDDVAKIVGGDTPVEVIGDCSERPHNSQLVADTMPVH